MVAPRVFHNYDVVDCFLTWARASGGRAPWAIYLPRFPIDDCDYPPVVPYLLTLVEAGAPCARAPRETGAAGHRPGQAAEPRWPGVAHVPLCAIGLRAAVRRAGGAAGPRS